MDINTICGYYNCFNLSIILVRVIYQINKYYKEKVAHFIFDIIYLSRGLNTTYFSFHKCSIFRRNVYAKYGKLISMFPYILVC